MPDETPTDRSDDMESELDQLDDHIDDAKAKAAQRKEDVEGELKEVAGEPEGEEEDAPSGDDPVGATEDSTDEDDGREAEEVANPT